MRLRRRQFGVGLCLVAASVVAGCSSPGSSDLQAVPSTRSGGANGAPTPQMTNAYAGDAPGHLSSVVRGDRPMVYVPNTQANTVQLIDPQTYRVVGRFRTGTEPQHVVPSWDLRTLWVNDDRGNELIPISARTGRPGRPISVADPYNLYFTPDGAHALVMAERLRRIDVRNPHTMRLQRSLAVPCAGVNHADYSLDLSFFVASCEFTGKLLAVDRNATTVIRVIDLNHIRTPGATSPAMARGMGGPKSELRAGASAMPQDVRLAPSGRFFLAADMLRNGVWVIDARTLRVSRFLHTGMGAHGVYPSRDATRIYVTNRDEGTISVLDAATLHLVALWKIPGGGSPDMGGVSADGSELWLSGRYNRVVYVIDTATGRVAHRIRVDAGPHGLCVWPQPGTYSLGHTGNMR